MENNELHATSERGANLKHQDTQGNGCGNHSKSLIFGPFFHKTHLSNQNLQHVFIIPLSDRKNKWVS